ncbi:hypothetical protein MalM25_13760 [Planctomycetes bacterium MalM25]|nr:hypothetical protein MalM25_13760 [Planctomycetes bacterium MalM25]
MEARLSRARRLACAVVALWSVAPLMAEAQGPRRPVSMQRQSGYRTPNFVVRAPTPDLAREIGESAEAWRESLAIEWLGKPMPNWVEPCPITAQVSPSLGAGGATSFVFDRGEVFGWEMNIQGSRERVLDSVLPHEITHTVFASHFRQPLPRWADEGACTTVEHRSEIVKQERLLIQFLKTNKGIPFTQMFAMTEYPKDILPLYAQGHSLTQFLMESRGKQEFLNFLTDGMNHKNWRRAVSDHYGHESLYELQTDWLDWVKQGRPRLDTPSAQPPVVLASASTPTPTAPAKRGRPSVYASRVADASAPAVSSVYAPLRR